MATSSRNRRPAWVGRAAVLILAFCASCSNAENAPSAPAPEASIPGADAGGADGSSTVDATDTSTDGPTNPPTDATSVDDAPDVIVDPDAALPPCNSARSNANSARPAAPSPAGQLACTADKPCPAGNECLGTGCDDNWHCVQHFGAPGEHPCSMDPADYCGCDGVTFRAVLVCPDRPYQRIGACEDGVSCDPTMLNCSAPEPTCGAGFVPSIISGRYNACVPISDCRCQFVWQCPQRDKYACDIGAGRCTALPNP